MHTWNRNISIRVKSTNRPFTLVPYEHGFRSLKAVFSLPEWSWKLWKCMQTLYAGATEDQIATWSQAKESSPRMPWHQAYKITKKENQENFLLRASLWKNQTSWEMKIFNPLQILHAVRRSEEMHKNALFEGRSTLVAMATTTACSRPEASLSYKTVAKRVKWLFFYLKLNKTLQVGTSTIHSNILANI